MNAFAFSSILLFILTFSISLLIFWKSGRKKADIVWGFFNLFAAVWGFGAYKYSTILIQESVLQWYQFAMLGAILTPVLYYHFAYEYLKLNNKKILLLVYAFGFTFAFVDLFRRDLFLSDVVFVFNQFYWHDWYKHKTIIFLVFYICFYWILLPYTFLLLVKHFQSSYGIRRQQLKYFIIGTSIGWVGPHGLFLTTFSLNFDLKIYPYSNFACTVLPIVVTYAILRHKLIDIQLVIKRSLVYSSLISIISIIFLIFILFFERLSQNIVGYKSVFGSLLAAIFIAIIFTPLRNKIQHFIDHLFYHGTPDEIAQQNELLRREVAQAEKLKAVATLASGMAHEIKNPLTAIQTFTEYLPQKQNDPEFLNRFSTIVGKEVNRINDLVHQLLDFAKPSPLTSQPTDIHALLDGIVDFLNNEFLKKSISVIKAYAATHYKDIPADPNKLKQAFLNILLNAIEACPNGGRIEIVTTNPNPEEIELRITYNGCGIDEKSLKYIFDPFFTTKDEGTGLGLSITQGIIKEHCGEISVESQPKQGATFRITFPIQAVKSNKVEV